MDQDQTKVVDESAITFSAGNTQQTQASLHNDHTSGTQNFGKGLEFEFVIDTLLLSACFPRFPAIVLS